MTLLDLLNRSQEFDATMRAVMAETKVPEGERAHAAYALGAVAMEHGHGIRSLLQVENPTAALALVRLQYEACVRAVWMKSCAPEETISLLSVQVSPDDPCEPSIFPRRIDDMLDAIESKEHSVGLRSIKAKFWDAMNSYTHGGLRQISRFLKGYEPELQMEALMASNALGFFAAMVIAGVCGREELARRLIATRDAHPECFYPTG